MLSMMFSEGEIMIHQCDTKHCYQTKKKKKGSWVACEKEVLIAVAIFPLNLEGCACDARCMIETCSHKYSFSYCAAVEW